MCFVLLCLMIHQCRVKTDQSVKRFYCLFAKKLCYKDSIRGTFLKVMVQPKKKKISHQLFQTCMILCIPWNIKEDIVTILYLYKEKSLVDNFFLVTNILNILFCVPQKKSKS